MGTSSSNGGPKGKTSLLPSWASGSPITPSQSPSGRNSDTDINFPELKPNLNRPPKDETEKWSNAKSRLTRYANKTSGASIKEAARGYLKTYGGAKKASKAAGRGIVVGAGFAAFLSGVVVNGLDKTLRDIGLEEFVGRSSTEILAKIADTIAPPGATNDEAVAREAIITALDNLYEKLLEEGKDISTLDALNEEMVNITLIEYVSAYIFKKWLYELGIAIEKNNLTEKDAIRLESQMEGFIRDEVKLGLKDVDIGKIQLKAINNHPVILNIIELAYSTLEK